MFSGRIWLYLQIEHVVFIGTVILMYFYLCGFLN